MSANLTRQLCAIAIATVVRTIKYKFPQHPDLGTRFKQHCIEEAYDELDVLLDDFKDGFTGSVILESVAEEIDIKDDDKEILCEEIYQILLHSSPPIELNLGISIYVNLFIMTYN